ncbi:methionyl-tRNA formyltransferase [Gracilibacillus ureilyticus]|uniref:Methionyl-tRNA formyltransferase n=1 Tax=Gracilibacillus ureilyticus TaxID=531814 RepID=A0A1H9L159_9BACI|nr:methionyl-tRNA formyltransferase [Gracilibacillus ureilyticus]SER05130.1 methionyl-tRNA formyltransferase [Gracilibacillus ureilyticus]
MKNIIFMGTPDFAVPVLEKLIEDEYHIQLVVTQPDRPKGRKKVLTPPPVKRAAEKHGLPVFQPEKIKDDYEKINQLQPDLIVTAAFGQILPGGLLDIPKFGCVNVHASLLPSLRGGAPIHYSILQGHEKTGVTIMYMAEKLDAGDIISQAETDILDEDDVASLHDKLSVIGAELLSETLPALFNGKIEPVKQNEDLATYAPNIRREEEEIDWRRTQQDVYNHIRGLHPWPVAFTRWQGKNMKIWRAEKYNKTTEHQPGVIIDITDDGLIVATGDNLSVKILELQPAGKKKMSVSDFLRGINRNDLIGAKLGE